MLNYLGIKIINFFVKTFEKLMENYVEESPLMERSIHENHIFLPADIVLQLS